LTAEAWRDVVDTSGAAVVLSLRSAPIYPVIWQYDRQSLRPTGHITASEQLVRLEAALDLLMRLGTAEDAEACRVLARHDFHAVRWAAVRLACNVGASFGFELLAGATNDPHPHVRRTAEKTLAATAAQVR
jgi:hypothetical protein